MSKRAEHKAFLDSLSASLQSHLSDVSLSKEQRDVGETEFFFNYGIPHLSEHSAKDFGLTANRFKKSFVMDSHEDYKKKMQPSFFTGGSGARLSKHPWCCI